MLSWLPSSSRDGITLALSENLETMADPTRIEDLGYFIFPSISFLFYKPLASTHPNTPLRPLEGTRDWWASHPISGTVQCALEDPNS